MSSLRQAGLPLARIKQHWGMLWIWLVPLAALAVVAYLAYSFMMQRGPVITITFETAEGITPQKTQVRYKAVTLGTVEEIELADDASQVRVKVRMEEQAESLLGKDTKFWVVRPRLTSGLSSLGEGLKTLVSGSYIAMDPGHSDGESKKKFDGLEKPPGVRSDQPGSVYLLEADSLGTIGQGAPVFYRDVHVGEVLSFTLRPESNKVRMRIFVEAPYDSQVVPETRFWRTSGIGLDTGPEGLRIEMKSLQAVLAGGITFAAPPGNGASTQSPSRTRFRLFDSEAVASTGFYDSVPYVTYVRGAVQGLTAGSDVELYGRKAGAVTDVSIVVDPRGGAEDRFAARVAFVLQPDRLFERTEALSEQTPRLGHEEVRSMVSRGFRAVIKNSSFVTGQKVVALQEVDATEEVELATEGDTLVVPGEVRSLEGISSSLAGIMNDIDSIRFSAIGSKLENTLSAIEQTVSSPELRSAIANLNATLQQAKALIAEARQGLKPAFEQLPEVAKRLSRAARNAERTLGAQGYGANSTLQRNLERLTEEAAEAANSIQQLTDYLNRHPEAVIGGRKGDEDE